MALMKSLKGQFLLSSPQMTDGNFARSMVLMIEHDEDGAMGVIVNHPSLMPVKQAWVKIADGPCEIDDVIYEGGPCPGPVLGLHCDPDASMLEICDGVHFTSDPRELSRLVRRDSQPLRLIVGYAGWAPIQLESELARRDWMVVPATAETIFSTDDSLWARLTKPRLNDIGLPSMNPDAIPIDPSMN